MGEAAVPGYWLGSDAQGRDLLSQLLRAVRPTMAMVVTVAALRLFVGTLVGVAAGWSVGRANGIWLTLISASLAVPVLIVALGVIAIVGIESGVTAFTLGLSLTGWAETARLVRQQTGEIKGQQYIEAARALGQPDSQIVLVHVLRQIAPMLWMLFAVEISNTLLVTAMLGFLGYYLGGGVWFQIEDFAMQRISGTPELGQMLAIAAENRERPEAMIFAGTVVFFTIMLCGVHRGTGGECLSYAIGADEPRWVASFGISQYPAGGALVPGRLYVTTVQGSLFSIGE